MTDITTGILTFSTAAAAWFEDHKRYIKSNTADSYGDALEPLNRFFGDKPINEIEIIHLRMYQGLRIARVCANTVNREVGVLQQVLRGLDEWRRLESRYRQLKEPPRRAGRSMTREEEQRLREVAFSRPGWRLAANCITIMLSTTMNFGELRQLRRRDVDLKRRRITVREGVKNTSRQRTIPLNNVALDSMTWILERWKQFGGSEDEHYILPHRPRGQRGPHLKKKTPWVLDQPTASIYSSFRNIRDAAGLPFLRICDCQTIAQKQHLSEHSDNWISQRGTGNLIGFPVRGGAA